MALRNEWHSRDQLGEKLDAFKKAREARIKALRVDRWIVTVTSIDQVWLFHNIGVNGTLPCPDLRASFTAFFP